MFEIFSQAVETLASKSGFVTIFQDPRQLVMILVSFVLLYLAIGRGFEPLLLLPIAFGMLLTNIPGAGLYHTEIFINETQHIDWELLSTSGGLLDYLYLGVKLGIYPPLIFLGVGAMTDFGPLIANPKSFIMGAAAQLGIFIAFCGALLLGFSPSEAGSIGIIGGADGYLYNNAACSLAVRFHCYCCLFLYGSGAHYPASHYEGFNNSKSPCSPDGTASPCF